jgi:hypothetical protein
MSLLPFAEWLASTSGSIALHESLFMYPVIESIHVLTLCLFVGMSVLLDFRLLGIGLKRVSVTDITDRLLPWMFVGFFIMVVSGVLLFYAIPIRSYQSVWFRLKVIMLIAAGINAWTFHNTVYKRVQEWKDSPVAPTRARLAGALSLILWAGIIVNGRMIAYNWFDCDMHQSALISWAAGCTAAQQK